MKIIVIFILFLVTGFSFLLKYLNYARRNAPIPINVSDVYDEETYKKQTVYKMDNLRFSIVSGIVGLVITLVYLVFNFHHCIYSCAGTENIYFMSYAILGTIFAITYIIGTIFNGYGTFIIEEKHGFNKTSVKTFITDQLKNLIINVIILFGLLSLFIWLYTLLNDWVFLAFYFVLALLLLCFSVLLHQLTKIFNKFTPLDDGELKDKVMELATKVGYSIKRVLVMDASKRSKHLNAYATGIGNTKTIVLYDTLIQRMEPDEVVAVLAHEIAHSKMKHVLLGYFMNLVTFAFLVGIGYYAITCSIFSEAFGFEQTNIAFGIYILGIISAPIMIVLNIPVSFILRKFEYSADKLAAEYHNAQSMVNALKKLAREDYANLTPHPFVVAAQYSHPPIHERIAALGDGFEILPFTKG